MKYASLMLTLCAMLFAHAELPTARAETIYGLTDSQQLVTFDSVDRTIDSMTPITGITGLGETLVGIDFRPATGELYGLATTLATYQVYKINPATGAATAVGSQGVGMSIKSFAIDPVSDEIRVVNNLGMNRRVDPDTGAISGDTNLAFAVGDPNVGTPQVMNLAYTNRFPGANKTTLYNLVADVNVLAIQSPQNDGTLHTVGPLGVTLSTLLASNGFDISGLTGIGYVVGTSLVGPGLVANTLYTIDLATGAISLAGEIEGPVSPLTGGGMHGGGKNGGSNGFGTIIDIATFPIPEPSTLVLAGCGGVALVVLARRGRGRKR